MKCEFIPIDYDYFDFNGSNIIRIFGRNEKNQKICLIDPYRYSFWAILKEDFYKYADEVALKIGKVSVEKSDRKSRVVETSIEKKKFLGRDVIAVRVYVSNYKDAAEISKEVSKIKGVDFCREYDLNIITKYIKERKLNPLQCYLVELKNLAEDDFGGVAKSEIDSYLLESVLDSVQKDFFPNVLAYDIETDGNDIGSSEIFMISLYSKNYKKVITWKDSSSKQDYVEVVKNEKEMIKRFVECVKSFNPDVLVGYFSDNFDLLTLKYNSKRYKISLELGVDGSEPKIVRGVIPSIKISGIVHVDIYKFIDAVFSQYLQSETLTLNDISKELLGLEKEDFDFSKILNMKDKDWSDFYSYNLRDSELAYLLFEKLWPDMYEFTRIIKEPLFEITRDRMSSHVENYIIHNIDRFNEIVEKKPLDDEISARRSLGKYEGAFVFEPKPGLYEDIVIFDFTSMYASVIVTYNLSKSTYLGNNQFSKEKGFFPIMLEEIINLRKAHKKEYNKSKTNVLKARSNAYKLLANAAYGYLGFFGARYYCREAAASTARLARENILLAIKKIENQGHKIIYSDTDSIAFLRGEKSHKEVLEMLDKINDELPGIMELDLEDFYKRGLFVSKRTTKAGAKKKYALIDEKGKLKIRGFETVRRDWCNLARNLQNKILESILKDGNEKNALSILKKTIKDLKERKISYEDVLIRTQIKKPLSEYLANSPHVIAAKKLEEKGVTIIRGMIIEYYIGQKNSKSKKVGDRVFLPDEKVPYDVDYYLNNQVLNAVENIFEVFGINVRDVIKGESQKKLF